jgi:hypothetical protein
MIVQHRSSCRSEDASEDLNRNYIAGPQLVAEQPNHLCPAPTKLFELHFKLSDEAASAAVRFKLPVLFAADIDLDKCSAHLLFTNPEVWGRHWLRPEGWIWRGAQPAMKGFHAVFRR